MYIAYIIIRRFYIVIFLHSYIAFFVIILYSRSYMSLKSPVYTSLVLKGKVVEKCFIQDEKKLRLYSYDLNSLKEKIVLINLKPASNSLILRLHLGEKRSVYLRSSQM